MGLLDRLFPRRHQHDVLPLFVLNQLDRSKRSYNEAWIRALCHSVYLSEDTALCRVLGRFKMLVDTGDFSVSAHLLLDGYWEMWLTEAICTATKPGMVAVDIGANLGYFALLFAELVGPAGRVHAFEANPPIAERARKSALVNGFPDMLTVYTQALGDVDGAEFSMFIPPQQPGGTYLAPITEATAADLPRVATRRLDSYPELLQADIIKIDVEGSEEAVTRGMEGIFAQNRPLTIFLEFVTCRYADPAGFLAEMLKWGFELAQLDLIEGVRSVDTAKVLSADPHVDQMIVLRR